VIQGSELFVILLVALVVMGPQRLPEMARKLGAWTAELRRAANEIRAGIEAEVGDVREIAHDLKAPLDEVTSVMKDTAADASEVTKSIEWTGPKPHSGPTPEDAMADLQEIEATGEPLTDAPSPTPSADASETPAADDTATEASETPLEEDSADDALEADDTEAEGD